VLGAKVLEVSPRGSGSQSGPIPLDRTRSPYQLPDALGDLTSAVSGLDTDKLSESLAVLAETFSETPPALRIALQGVARFSQTLTKRDAQLRNLLSNANKVTAILSERSDGIVKLMTDTNALLVELQSQSRALDRVAVSLAAVSEQLKGVLDDNRETLKPALDKVDEVLAILDNRKEQVRSAIKKFNVYAMSLGESMSSGPFFKFYIANLLPGQFIQPFVDAAFSDLGLDPNVLLPSQLTDPQTGAPGTPALPAPYPRTGQGGEPRLTVPEAITGVPGDPRYPYREPPPPPPPGGPPPGPPAAPAASTEPPMEGH
jgi:phospholipid/cholesterol/gamma-HCH transport system substrate-binding protein